VSGPVVSSDLRANSAQRALLTLAMRAIAFFQGRAGGGGEGVAKGAAVG
jgi:hypothetical protein